MLLCCPPFLVILWIGEHSLASGEGLKNNIYTRINWEENNQEGKQNLLFFIQFILPYLFTILLIDWIGKSRAVHLHLRFLIFFFLVSYISHCVNISSSSRRPKLFSHLFVLFCFGNSIYPHFNFLCYVSYSGRDKGSKVSKNKPVICSFYNRLI